MTRTPGVEQVSNSESPPPQERTRKPWVQPELVEYGSVAQLTQTGGSTRNEASVPRNRATGKK
jgi:hypothetical protein